MWENHLVISLVQSWTHDDPAIPFLGMLALIYQEEKDGSKSLETLISEEGKDLNLYNNHILFYYSLLDNFP